jgi:cytochrome c553
LFCLRTPSPIINGVQPYFVFLVTVGMLPHPADSCNQFFVTLCRRISSDLSADSGPLVRNRGSGRAAVTGIAKYFADLEPKASGENIEPALVERGGMLAVKLRCASCHLPGFSGRQQIPRLAKQRVDYLIHSMQEFRDNKRSGADTLMSNVVSGLSDADLTSLAHYVASFDPSAASPK